MVLVDVRTPEEREVSQIPGNVLTPDEFLARKAEFQGTDYLVVPYWYSILAPCSSQGLCTAMCTDKVFNTVRESGSRSDLLVQHCGLQEWKICR